MGRHGARREGGILVDVGIEMVPQAVLGSQKELPVGRLDHDLSGILPLEKFLAAADEYLIGRLGDRAPLALARAFILGHRSDFPFYALEAFDSYSGEGSCNSEPQPQSTLAADTRFVTTARNHAHIAVCTFVR